MGAGSSSGGIRPAPAVAKKNDVEAGNDDTNTSAHHVTSFLSRNVIKVVVTTLAVYAAVHAVLSQDNICTKVSVADVNGPSYLFGVILCVAFILAWKLLSVGHTLVYDSGPNDPFVLSHNRCLLVLASVAPLLGLVSMVMALVRPRYGGVCRDAFGVESLAVVWADLLVSAPVLGFAVVLADENKTTLTRGDKLLVASVAALIPVAVATFSVTSAAGEVVLIVFVALLKVPSFGAFLLLRRAASAVAGDLAAATSSREWLAKLQHALARKRLATKLLVILPVFPLTYVLAMAGIVDSEVLQCVYLLAAMLYKVRTHIWP